MVKDTYIILSFLLFPVKFVYFIVSSNLVIKKNPKALLQQELVHPGQIYPSSRIHLWWARMNNWLVSICCLKLLHFTYITVGTIMITFSWMDCSIAWWHQLSKKNYAKFIVIFIPDIRNFFAIDRLEKVRAFVISGLWTIAGITAGPMLVSCSAMYS